MHFRIAFFVAGPLLVSILAAQQTRPTTAPEPDPSTPRGALRAFQLALHDGDRKMIRRLLPAHTSSEKKMVEAVGDTAAAEADLYKAAKEAFGKEGSVVLGDADKALDDSLLRIASAEIVVNGDSATVTYPDQKASPHVLKKEDGEWKVPQSELGKPVDEATLQERLADVASQIKVAREMTAEIKEGKFASAQEAKRVWTRRMIDAASSQPATHPGTPPNRS